MSDRHTFSEAFELLLKVQSPKAKNTYAQTANIVAHLKPWFDRKAPYLDDFENSFEECWAEYRADQALGPCLRSGRPRRLAHDRRYLVMALKRAQKKNWIKKSFSKTDFALNEAHEPIGKYVDDICVIKLLKALDRHPKTQLQVMMALTMGMRLSEILKLRKDELNLERREITLDPNRLKTRRPRKVAIPIANTVYAPLVSQYDLTASSFVFPMERDPNRAQSDNRHWWTLARKDAGVKCRFHDLRHTAITNAIAAGIPAEWVTQVFGATPQVISRVYAHLREDDKEQFRTLFDGRFNKTAAAGAATPMHTTVREQT